MAPYRRYLHEVPTQPTTEDLMLNPCKSGKAARVFVESCLLCSSITAAHHWVVRSPSVQSPAPCLSLRTTYADRDTLCSDLSLANSSFEGLGLHVDVIIGQIHPILPAIQSDIITSKDPMNLAYLVSTYINKSYQKQYSAFELRS